MSTSPIQYKGHFLFHLKIGLLLFWAVWFLTAFSSNLMDLLTWDYGILSQLKFHSGNYMALEKVLSIYGTPTYVLKILFHMDIIAQASATILFFIATFCSIHSQQFCWKYINLAFVVSIFIWLIFLVMEEIFLAYSFEKSHILLGLFELVSLLVIQLL